MEVMLSLSSLCDVVYLLQMTPDTLSATGFPGSQSLANMFEFYQSGKCERSVEETKKLYPDIPDLASWLEDHRDAVIEAMQ